MGRWRTARSAHFDAVQREFWGPAERGLTKQDRQRLVNQIAARIETYAGQVLAPSFPRTYPRLVRSAMFHLRSMNGDPRSPEALWDLADKVSASWSKILDLAGDAAQHVEAGIQGYICGLRVLTISGHSAADAQRCDIDDDRSAREGLNHE